VKKRGRSHAGNESKLSFSRNKILAIERSIVLGTMPKINRRLGSGIFNISFSRDISA
jgi:hypothetical protein